MNLLLRRLARSGSDGLLNVEKTTIVRHSKGKRMLICAAYLLRCKQVR